jgi:hypothetical protein
MSVSADELTDMIGTETSVSESLLDPDVVLLTIEELGEVVIANLGQHAGASYVRMMILGTMPDQPDREALRSFFSTRNDELSRQCLKYLGG